MKKVFIGYDPREAIAFHVCVNSIVRKSTEPVSITPLALNNLKEYKELHRDGSNDFVYSRFLVPFLSGYQGWALYIDGDMILRDDISKVFQFSDPNKAVFCVKHDYKSRVREKYLNSKNEDYPRKNWSSVILWNCAHHKNKHLTPKVVSDSTGAYLHRFSWLADEDIGEIPSEWNWLPDEFGRNQSAKLLHWTLGTPCFIDYACSPMAEEWHAEKIFTTYSMQAAIK